MSCPSCRSEIPKQQSICPLCYTTIGQFTEKPSRNVIFFFSSPENNGLYSGRVQTYLQPDFVRYNFYADTDHAFDQITQNSATEWNLLITDTARMTLSVDTIARFRAKNPGCLIAALSRVSAQSDPIEGVVNLRAPSELDPWLLMMRSLLRQT